MWLNKKTPPSYSLGSPLFSSFEIILKDNLKKGELNKYEYKLICSNKYN
ncbi:hypothetical protein SAMN05444267_10761 [Chryseobacterium polytrichastri]|uniref:Uncharacterized protein n=1 Tax=Chryseobacterium polytrichastri TaxID=1302687 RepID=A0A1M7KXK4_9FLAO|nr:hypothetical protein SAMN05444267_10761 [Chryseobacterium polytrichastri]